MQIIYKKIDEIKAYEKNPRKNEEAVEMVTDSIKEFGFKNPVIIDKNGTIVCGHTRYKAAMRLKMQSIPCICAEDLSEEQIKAFRIIDNKTNDASRWDAELLLSELKEIGEIDMEQFGFPDITHKEVDFENLEAMTSEENEEEYNGFLDKFKPKKTTDDCYTPPEVYEAVKEWVVENYEIKPEQEIIRPFYPGGDYKKEKYPQKCVVIDNPPFSILTEIVRFYEENEINYFLFEPTLTAFSTNGGKSKYIITGGEIIYENGAIVNTSFISNMGKYKVRTAPELTEKIKQAQKANETKETRKKIEYPENLITAAMIGGIASRGVDFKLLSEEVYFIREVGEQNKDIYGGGFLISEKAAAEKAAAEKAAAEKAENIKIELTEREKQIVEMLGKQESDEKFDI